MSTQEPTREPLISADSHVVPLPTFWREYLPAALRDRAPVVESTDEGDFTVFEGRRSAVMAINSIAGKARDGQGFAYRRSAEQVAGGHDPAARVADQDRDGVVAEVLYGGGPLPTADRELFVASHYAYNEWLARYCATDPKRLLGVATSRSVAGDRGGGIRRAEPGPGAVHPRVPSGHWWDAEWTPVRDALVGEDLPEAPRRVRVRAQAPLRRRPRVLTDVMMTKMEMAGRSPISSSAACCSAIRSCG
jgi:hypothetical protein